MNIEHLENNSPLTVVYHRPCMDGTASAWAVKQRFPEKQIEWVGAQYGYDIDKLELTKDTDLLIVDFSFSEEDTLTLVERAKSVSVIDHHKSAEAYLGRLIESGVIHGIFDMSKSGALLTCETFFPNKPVPELTKYVSDRDLFRFEYPETKAVYAAMYARGLNIEDYEKTLELPIEQLISEGNEILEYQEWCLLSTLSDTLFWMTIHGHNVPVVNGTRPLASDICAKLYNLWNVPFIVSLSRGSRGFGLSLRSKKGEGVDVSEIGALFNGGGHANASGGKAGSLFDIGTVTFPTDKAEFDLKQPEITESIQRYIDSATRELLHSTYLIENAKGVMLVINTPKCFEQSVINVLVSKYSHSCAYQIVATQIKEGRIYATSYDMNGQLIQSNECDDVTDMGDIVDSEVT